MTDIVSASVRSRMMSGIRGTNTRPELIVRSGLHQLGLRYSLHSSSLPGKPDIVFTRWNAVVLVHGCFWHGHNCNLFRWPNSRKHFWHEKISKNQLRDLVVMDALRSLDWRVLTVWECALKGSGRLPVENVIQKAAAWIKSDNDKLEIRGLILANDRSD